MNRTRHIASAVLIALIGAFGLGGVAYASDNKPDPGPGHHSNQPATAGAPAKTPPRQKPTPPRQKSAAPAPAAPAPTAPALPKQSKAYWDGTQWRNLDK